VSKEESKFRLHWKKVKGNVQEQRDEFDGEVAFNFRNIRFPVEMMQDEIELNEEEEHNS
jgi:hypothetical protein